MKKNEVRTMIVLGIVFVVFTILSFAPPFLKNGAFWLAYLFGILSIGVQVYVLKSAFAGQESAKSKFYGFPIAKIGMVYMIAQLVLSILTMAISLFVPAWVAVVVYIVMLGAAAIGLISSEAVREEVVRQEVIVQADTGAMMTLRSSLSMLLSKAEDDILRKALQDLADECKYSDPVSNDMTRAIEAEMTTAAAVLKEYLMNNDTEKALSACKRVSGLLEERNRLCKEGKKK